MFCKKKKKINISSLANKIELAINEVNNGNLMKYSEINKKIAYKVDSYENSVKKILKDIKAVIKNANTK